ncbi:MAG: DUF1684 domain-containing protein [Vicingaceae bacterium]
MVALTLEAQEGLFSDEEYLFLHAQTEVFRAEQDLEFKNEETSPLLQDSIPNFLGLDYFDWNAEFIRPAKFQVIENGKVFEMPTTTERLPLYIDYAILTFMYRDSTYSIHAYQNVAHSQKANYDSSLFVPFNDYTNGIETYGGGRYMDISIPRGKKVIVDFNRAYNPYCSYNDKYSCPIPPDENKLPFRVEAGVKKYHE